MTYYHTNHYSSRLYFQADFMLCTDTSFCEVDIQVSTDSSTNTSATPDDPDYSLQWDLTHVTVQKAWAAGVMGSNAVKVCMIDTGIDYTHPDISANMWINPVEAAGAGATAANGYKNGIDDDGDGKLSNPPLQGLHTAQTTLLIQLAMYLTCARLSVAQHQKTHRFTALWEVACTECILHD